MGTGGTFYVANWAVWDVSDRHDDFLGGLFVLGVRGAEAPMVIRREGEGHVYQGRFNSFPVESGEHLSTACRYVERNPVRAGLVEHAEDWLWSSAGARLHPDDPRALPLCDWPIPQPVDWLDRVNQARTGAELEALRRCAERGSPYGTDPWVDQTARHLGLEATLRSRGRRPKKK
jgi:putative transposase